MIITNNSREEWLEQRKRYVTASDVAALLGLSPYKSTSELFLEKIGVEDGFQGDESTQLALELEPWVLEQARKRFWWDVRGNASLYVDDECPRLAATPDGLMPSPWGPTVVQVKVTRAMARDDCREFTKSGRPTKQAYMNGAPEHYRIQVQAEMACTGASHGVLLVLHTAPPKLRAYYIPRDEEMIARIRREVVLFWDGVDISERVQDV